MTRPVLVTGAAGFAGGHLLQHLAPHHTLVGWSRSAPPPDLAPLASWDAVDLLDPAQVRAAIVRTRPSAVYHCAGLPHVAESFSDTAQPLATNVLGTHHLFDALRRAGIACRVLVAGSATVYARSDTPIAEDHPVGPSSPYGLSKLAQEQLGVRALREDGIDVILTRPFNHTGPRQSAAFVAPAVARQIAEIERGAVEAIIRVGNLDAVRDLTDVRDVARAYAALMQAGTPGTIYNVASGAGRTIRSVLDALVSRARVPVRVEHDPSRMRPNDLPVLVGDATRLRETTGWRPEVGFERMLEELLDYWRRAH